MTKSFLFGAIALVCVAAPAHAFNVVPDHLRKAFTAANDYPQDVDGKVSAECAVIRVSPPDHDRNPGYRVNISLKYDTADGDLSQYDILHSLADGQVINRSEQYSNSRFNWWKDGRAQWSGWRGALHMVGMFDPNHNSYVERIFRGDRLQTVIETKCHQDYLGD